MKCIQYITVLWHKSYDVVLQWYWKWKCTLTKITPTCIIMYVWYFEHFQNLQKYDNINLPFFPICMKQNDKNIYYSSWISSTYTSVWTQIFFSLSHQHVWCTIANYTLILTTSTRPNDMRIPDVIFAALQILSPKDFFMNSSSSSSSSISRLSSILLLFSLLTSSCSPLHRCCNMG